MQQGPACYAGGCLQHCHGRDVDHADAGSGGFFSAVTFLDGKRPVVCFTDRNRFVSIYQIDQPGVRVAINPGRYNEAFEREQVRQAQLTVTVENSTLFDESDPGQADLLERDDITSVIA